MADLKISQLTGATTPLAGTEVLPVVQSSTTVKVSVANLTAGRAVSMASATISGDLTVDTNTLLVDSTNNYVGIGGTPSAPLEVFASNSGIVINNTAASNKKWRLGGGSASQFLITEAGVADRFRIDTAGDISAIGGNFVPSTAAKGINFTANTPAAGMTSQLLNWYEEGTWTPAYTNATPPTTPYTMTVASATYTRIGRQVTVRAWIYTQNVNTAGAVGALQISGLPFTSAASSAGYSAMAIGQARGWVTAPSYGYVDGTSIILMYRTAADADDQTLTAAGLTTGAVANKNQLMFTATYFV
jgi:hypothetical protein